MKPALLQMLGALAATTLIGIVPATRGQDYLEDAPAEIAEDAVAQVPPGLDNLAQAPTPSAAVEAYARARLANPDNLLVDQVYVRRMVQLGAPEMCVSQAERITRSVPDDYLAWAVLAFNSAAQNDFADALTQLAHAARYGPRDQFVQRTGGQLMAWFDTAADQSQLPAAALDAARDIRSRLGGRGDFAEAYRDARSFYQQQGQGEQGTVSPVPATPQVAPVEPVPPVEEPGYITYGYDYGYSYPIYGGTYVGYPWYADTCCWPWVCSGATIIVSRDRGCWPRFYGRGDWRGWSRRSDRIHVYDNGRHWDGHRSGFGLDRRGGDFRGSAVRNGTRSTGTLRGGSSILRRPASTTRHPLWGDTPGAKRSTGPSLRPPSSRSVKPSSHPGLNVRRGAGVRVPASSSHASRAPARIGGRSAAPAPRAAPGHGLRVPGRSSRR